MIVPKVPRRKFVCLGSSMTLTVCFFLPAVDGCGSAPIYPSDWLPSVRLGTFHVDFALFGAAYVFGFLAAVLCYCDMRKRRGLLRAAAGGCLVVLLAFSISMAYYWIYALNPFGGPWGAPDVVLANLLWPIVGFSTWVSVNAIRPGYRFDAKLVIWQFAGALMATAWFLQWFVRAGFDGSYCGLWLSAFCSLVLLACFAVDARLALECSWKGLVPALMGFEKKGRIYSSIRFVFGRKSPHNERR